jgi:hypothetical protein
MKANLLKSGERVADVHIVEMRLNGEFVSMHGHREWVERPHGDWFRFMTESRIEDSGGEFALFLETGEVFNLSRLHKSGNGETEISTFTGYI